MGTGGGGWGHPQGDMHMVAARLAPWFGPDEPILALAAWTIKLRKHYSHLCRVVDQS